MPDEHSEQNKKEGMRLTNTENDLFSSGFVLPEHRGGDGWTILHGDALDIIPHFQPGAFDAVITDPPYAGGGAKPSEKTRTTNQKYSSMSADKALPDFDGDQKDQLSWMLWTAVWMSKVRAACKPGAPICVFIDWRQLPPVDEHADRRTGLAGGADFAHPDGSPQHPAQLVFLVPVKIRQGLVSAHTAVLLVGRAGFLARLCPAARIGRVGDDRVERAGLEMRDNVQRIAV